MKKKLNFLITSGATREYIDPVRYITNASTGAMGAALVGAAIKAGAKVTFIAGEGSERPKGKYKIINVVSARDMFNAVKDNLNKHEVFIFAAAVSDYAPTKKEKLKIKKRSLSVNFTKNPDIAAYAGQERPVQSVSVCFALETDNFLKNAKTKLKNKNADFIVLNGAGSIGAKNTDAKIIFSDGKIKNIAGSKINAAKKIVNEAIKLYE
jgi:phosphopantothenoylcysteine synthetase/decarboxylase